MRHPRSFALEWVRLPRKRLVCVGGTSDPRHRECGGRVGGTTHERGRVADPSHSKLPQPKSQRPHSAERW